MLNGFTSNNAFSVAKGNINVVISVVENDDGSITIMANVTDEDGDPIKDHPVEFVLDGESIGTGITEINGIASINVPVSKIDNGTHNITIIVAGNNNFNTGVSSIEFAKRSPRNNDNDDTNDTDDLDDDINGTSNNSVAVAAMKETGIPLIIILLILMSCIGLLYRKK